MWDARCWMLDAEKWNERYKLINFFALALELELTLVLLPPDQNHFRPEQKQ